MLGSSKPVHADAKNMLNFRDDSHINFGKQGVTLTFAGSRGGEEVIAHGVLENVKVIKFHELSFTTKFIFASYYRLSVQMKYQS